MLVTSHDRVNINVTVTLRRHKLYINHPSVSRLTIFTGVSITRDNNVTLLIELNITKDALEFLDKPTLCYCGITREVLSRNTSHRNTSQLTFYSDSLNGLEVVEK